MVSIILAEDHSVFSELPDSGLPHHVVYLLVSKRAEQLDVLKRLDGVPFKPFFINNALCIHGEWFSLSAE
jgi:hypothetical protein